MVLILCIILFTMTACPPEPTPVPDPVAVLSVTPSSIALGADNGESATIAINARYGDDDDPWNLTLDSDASAFLTANMSSGRGSASLKVTTTSKNTGQRRSGTITISTPHKTVTVSVTQDAGTAPDPVAVLSVTPGTIAFGAENGESATVTVTAKYGDDDDSWDLTLDSNASAFLKTNMSSGRGSASLKITTTSKNTDKPRSGTITIKSTHKTATVNITQEAAPVVNNDMTGSTNGWSEGNSGEVIAK